MSDLARTEVSPHATSVNCVSSLAILTRAGLCFDTASCDTLLEMLQPQHSWCFWPKASYFPTISYWFVTVFLFSIYLAVQNKSTQIAEALRIGNCPRAALKQQISGLPIVFHMALFCRNPYPYAHLGDVYTYLQYIIYIYIYELPTKITQNCSDQWPPRSPRSIASAEDLKPKDFLGRSGTGVRVSISGSLIRNNWVSWVLFVAGIFVKFV